MICAFFSSVTWSAGPVAPRSAEHLPGMIRDWALDLVVVNGENAAGGFGITEAIYQEFFDAGADAVTLGNHAWDQREALVFIERAPRLIRPANFPRGTPGRGAALIDTKNGKRALVVNAIGRVFMTPFDDPFAVLARELEACPLRDGADPSWSISIAGEQRNACSTENGGCSIGMGRRSASAASRSLLNSVPTHITSIHAGNRSGSSSRAWDFDCLQGHLCLGRCAPRVCQDSGMTGNRPTTFDKSAGGRYVLEHVEVGNDEK